jgi:hypothetical protein
MRVVSSEKFVLVHTDGIGILPDVANVENATGQFIKFFGLDRTQKTRRYLCVFRYLFERHTLAAANLLELQC